MASPGDRELQDQMRADPRIQEIVRRTPMGSIDTAALRALGYDVPDKYSLHFGGRAGTGFLSDGKMDGPAKFAVGVTIGLGTLASMGLAGVGPLAAGGASTAASGGVGGAATGAVTGTGGVASGGLAAGTAAATGGAMDWLDPLLRYGVPTAGALVGAHMENRANADATAAQTEYLNKALEAAQEEQRYRRTFDEEARTYERGRYGEERDYGRGQYSNFLSRLEPYRQAGGSSLSRLEGLLGPRGGSPSPGGSSEMVTMRAPTGETQAVPAHQAAQWEQLGARRV